MRRFVFAGVYDALQKKYLKTLMFCVCETVDGAMIEEYACKIPNSICNINEMIGISVTILVSWLTGIHRQLCKFISMICLNALLIYTLACSFFQLLKLWQSRGFYEFQSNWKQEARGIQVRHNRDNPSLHHEKRKCGDPTSLETVNIQFEEIDHVKGNVTSETIEDSSLPEESSQTFLHFRFWMIFLLVSSVVGFGIVMMLILKGHKGQKKRGKGVKARRRSSHTGL